MTNRSVKTGVAIPKYQFLVHTTKFQIATQNWTTKILQGIVSLAKDAEIATNYVLLAHL